MATVEDALKTQLKNIEKEYGRSIDEWAEVIRNSGLTKHNEVVAMLKSEHGMKHGAAHRLSLVTRDAKAAGSKSGAAKEEPASLGPIGDAVLSALRKLGEFEVAQKKGYVSLRRRKQFAMVKPGKDYVNVGLILPEHEVTERLESAATFNALFTHRVRVHSTGEVDAELKKWLKAAFEAAA